MGRVIFFLKPGSERPIRRDMQRVIRSPRLMKIARNALEEILFQQEPSVVAVGVGAFSGRPVLVVLTDGPLESELPETFQGFGVCVQEAGAFYGGGSDGSVLEEAREVA